MNRGQSPQPRCRPRLAGDGLVRPSGRTTICRNTHHIMYPTGSHPVSRAKVSLGVRGHTPAPQRAHAPPDPDNTNHHQRLDIPQPAQVSRAQPAPMQSDSCAYAELIRKVGHPARLGPLSTSPAIMARTCGFRLIWSVRLQVSQRRKQPRSAATLASAAVGRRPGLPGARCSLHLSTDSSHERTAR
jgi:hypothetical protein